MDIDIEQCVNQCREGRWLCFDFTPNLKIVGTTHSLGIDDKQLVEELLDETDFSAIELDRVRADYSRKIDLVVGKPQGDDPATFYVNTKFDFIYLKWISKINKKKIKNANEVAQQEMDQADLPRRDLEEDEFDFIIASAEQRGKPCYLVDLPTPLFLERLVQLPLTTKLAHMVFETLVGYKPKPFVKILQADRESYMLEDIAREEGPLESMTRQGVLFVGYSHAVNYLNEGGISLYDEVRKYERSQKLEK